MDQRNIAWLANNNHDVSIFASEMENRGFANRYYSHAVPAVEDLTKIKKYSLVVINTNLAPGKMSDDPRIKEAMHPLLSATRPNYWKVALKVAELTHAEGSVNKDTSIVVAGIYYPERDVLWPNARSSCLTAGICDYIYLADPGFDFDAFYGRLEEFAGRNKLI